MATVLLTGFEPFAGARVNPSWEAVRRLAELNLAGPGAVTWRAVRLPVAFDQVRPALADAITQAAPAVVIATGLAATRPGVSVERIAVNLVDARIPDNAGAQPREAEVVPGGPAGRWSSLPVVACVEAARALGHDVSASLSAGAYVCNAAMYHLLDLTAGTEIRAGFVHVPASGPDSIADHDAVAAPVAYLPLADTVAALAVIARTALAHR